MMTNDTTREAAARQNLTPQARSLLDYLKRTGSVTQREALLDLQIQSLTKRISELRKGFVIVSDQRTHKTTQQRYVRYFYKGVKPEAKKSDVSLPAAGDAYEDVAG